MMSAIAKAEALNSKECYWHDINFYTYDILPFYGLFLKNGNRKLCNNNRIPEVYSELSQSSKMKLVNLSRPEHFRKLYLNKN